MLYNLEPDSSVTGGAWYSDQDFESEFVDVLNQQCFKFLEQKVFCAKYVSVHLNMNSHHILFKIFSTHQLGKITRAS